MTDPAAFAAVDRGTATVAVSLVARLDDSWRLLGATSAPVGVGPEPLLRRLAARLIAADPALARSAGLDDPVAASDIARVECVTTPAPLLAVIGATDRAIGPLVVAGETTGWRVRALRLEGTSILELATRLADPAIDALVAGAEAPPAADERRLLDDLVALIGAAEDRRPDLPVVLVGSLAEPAGRAGRLISRGRPAPTLLAPLARDDDGRTLRAMLDELRGGDGDGRRALARAAATLASVLGRRIEIVEVGASGGARVAAAPEGGARVAAAPAGAVPGSAPPAGGVSGARRDSRESAEPGEPGERREPEAAFVARARLVPSDVTDEAVDAVVAWLALPLDRLRVRDRLRELVLDPWTDAAGEGAVLRLAAARAAVERLLAATPSFRHRGAPEMVIAAGGAWAVAPGPAVALALADVVRRPGAVALAFDHARLLAPLGTIEDERERRRLISDLRHDLLVPLGSVLMPAGVRAARAGGRLTVRGADGEVALELVPGGLELVDLPPGERATVDVRFRDRVELGARVRHSAFDVTGGLAGLLVDLRDIPLRLPDRLDRRRELLRGWQGALWAGLDA